MKSKLMLFVLILSISGILFGKAEKKEDGEVYFQFDIKSKSELATLTKIISIDNVIGNQVFAYANAKELAAFKKLNYDHTILQHPGTLYIPEMAKSISKAKEWDTYPTYDVYVSMMYEFAETYPNLCRIEDIGSTVNGRELLFAVISDNVNQEENEPEFMYTSTMHGDETVGYILMLRLINYLLENYGSDSEITDMLDNIEIWINPNANPDGTYYGGNNSVFGARRYNGNYVDLNRNFPDPEDGEHPDGNSHQPETIAMMDLAEAHNFVHSANIHSGAEVLNYPWDTWSDLHADDLWYQDICHAYADMVHDNSSGYMTGFDDGVTNGYAWYSIDGGRQDYMNYFQRCREVTFELSDTKLLPESQLDAHWGYNKQALLNYIKNVQYGIRGIVTDNHGNPLEAQITMIGHDFDNSEVMSDSDNGDYYRMCKAGSYSLLVESVGFMAQTIENVSVYDGQVTIVDVELEALPNTPVLTYYNNTAMDVEVGESISFKILINNVGIVPTYNIYGVLSSEDPYVEVTSGQSVFPDLLPGNIGESNSSFEVMISEQCPDKYFAEFSFYLACTGFDSLLTFEIPIGVEKILVYDIDGNHNSGYVLKTSLENLNQDVDYSTNNLPSNLSEYSAIFLCMGVYDQNGELSSNDANLLDNYLTNNGRIYLEGGDAWYNSSENVLRPNFGITGMSDGSNDTYGIIGCDTTFMQGVAFNYYGDNNYMDHLEPTGDAYPFFYNQTPSYYNGIAKVTQNSKTLGVSFEFGGIPENFQDSVLYKYLTFFDIDTTIFEGELCVAGDVNADGNINVGDIIQIINFILGTAEPEEYEQCAADYNLDFEINVQDIISIVSYILNTN